MRATRILSLILTLALPRVATPQVAARAHLSGSTSRASLASSSALERWEMAVQSKSQSPDEWSAVGQALYDARRYREAVAAFERGLALRAKGSSGDAWYVARAYAQLGNKTQALRWLMHAQQLGFRDELAVGREPAFDKYRGEIRLRGLVRPSVCLVCRSRTSAIATRFRA